MEVAPGSQFLAKTILIGAVGTFSPPGLDAIPGPLPVVCDTPDTLADTVMQGACPVASVPDSWFALQTASDEALKIQDHVRTLTETAKLPVSWSREGIEAPSQECRDYASQVLGRIAERYGVIPYKVALSKEVGVFAAYRREDSSNVLRIEVDNELDAVAVLSVAQSVTDSGILEEDDIEESIINAFLADA